jgi:hypothetical protein
MPFWDSPTGLLKSAVTDWIERQRTSIDADHGKSVLPFIFLPLPTAPQAREVANASTRCDRLDVGEIADKLEVHSLRF